MMILRYLRQENRINNNVQLTVEKVSLAETDIVSAFFNAMIKTSNEICDERSNKIGKR